MSSSHRVLRSSLLLFLAAGIWGFAFVAQRVGMDHLGPFAFNGIRFVLGCLSLVPVLLWQRRSGAARGDAPSALSTLLAGALAGLVLFGGASLQQIGLVTEGAGKSAFITGLYIVIVPFLGRLLGQAIRSTMVAGAVLALAGLFLISVTGDFRLGAGDPALIVGAFFWAGHILLINHLVARHDPVKISMAQFLVCGLCSLAVAGCAETVTLEAVRQAAVPLLFGGICSVGVAYTLQVVGQKNVPPGPASIILSMETVFAALGGWLLLGEGLGPRGLAGCALMLAGMVVAQLRRRER